MDPLIIVTIVVFSVVCMALLLVYRLLVDKMASSHLKRTERQAARRAADPSDGGEPGGSPER